jgi:hypothetical protein
MVYFNTYPTKHTSRSGALIYIVHAFYFLTLGTDLKAHGCPFTLVSKSIASPVR